MYWAMLITLVMNTEYHTQKANLVFIFPHLFLLVPDPEPRAPFFCAVPLEPSFLLAAGVFLALEFPEPFKST